MLLQITHNYYITLHEAEACFLSFLISLLCPGMHLKFIIYLWYSVAILPFSSSSISMFCLIISQPNNTNNHSYCALSPNTILLHHITTSMHIILSKHVIIIISMAYCIFVFLLHQLTIVWAKTHLLDKPFSSSVSFTHPREYCTRIQRTLNFYYFCSFTCGRK